MKNSIRIKLNELFNEIFRVISKKISLFFKKNKKDTVTDYQKLSYTFLSSIVLIFSFFMWPIYSDYQKKNKENMIEVTNKSKSDFEKVLDGEVLEKKSKIDQDLDLKNLYEDVFKSDELPTDTVRLTASTIQQLFKETNYSLENVRETKLVKPIRLSLLPEEMKKIENTKKRKTLFIQIVLPLILEENTKIKIDRIKLFNILNKNNK